MGALEDLQAANAAEAAELTTFLNDIAGQVAGGVSAADAEAIVTAINAAGRDAGRRPGGHPGRTAASGLTPGDPEGSVRAPAGPRSK